MRWICPWKAARSALDAISSRAGSVLRVPARLASILLGLGPVGEPSSELNDLAWSATKSEHVIYGISVREYDQTGGRLRMSSGRFNQRIVLKIGHPVLVFFTTLYNVSYHLVYNCGIYRRAHCKCHHAHTHGLYRNHIAGYCRVRHRRSDRAFVL